ncbi:uncharacterized protein LOC143274663 [Babylonia areolata]|uniref:uncharacterized protein LOC143274663 n=1 Tax=Babylonia areolata TaxID=304850 RepID=UPI003FD391E0
MDMCEDYFADFDRYAFLLGSALRNDDLEQFFCIYDSIIPKELPSLKVEEIKERAREIADLPEEDFSQLVVKASDFSLAHGHPLPPPGVAMWTNGQVVSNHVAEKKAAQADVLSDVARCDQYRSAFSPPCQTSGMREDDSPASSVPSGTSVSSEEALDMEERGAHDYFPQPAPSQPTQHEADPADSSRYRVGKSLSVGDMYLADHFDEAVMVENDSDSIESPRSDASSGIQLPDPALSRRAEGRVGREGKPVPMGSLFEPQENVHKKLYGSSFLASTAGKRARSSSCHSTFSKESNPIGGGRVTTRDDSTYSRRLVGPSGRSRLSPDLADFIGVLPSTLDSALQSSSYNLSNKSVASDTAAGEGKKKKKKKKDSKDENGQEEKSLLKSCDVNGNPLPTVTRKDYQRLRQSPSSQEKTSTESGSVTSNNDSATQKGDRHGMGNKSEDPQHSSSLVGNGSAEKRKRARKGGQTKSTVEAQNCPDYVGDCKDVNQLVKYINNEINQKTLKKRGLHLADSGDHGTAPVNITSHKNDKSKTSSKQLTTTGVGENAEDGLTPASETTQLLRSTESFTTYSSIDDHLPSLAASGQTAGKQNHGEDQEASSEVVQEVPVEMGNSPASEKQLDPLEIASPKSPKTVENHTSNSILAKSAHSTVKTETQPNHILSIAKSENGEKIVPSGDGKDKVVPTGEEKKGVPTLEGKNKGMSSGEGKNKDMSVVEEKDKGVPTVEGKDKGVLPGEGKGKGKNGGTNNHKKDGAHSTDNNYVSKKSKGKLPRMVGKAESVCERVSSAGVQKEKRVSVSANGCLSDDPEKASVEDNSSASLDSPVTHDISPVNAQDDNFITVVSTKRKKRGVQSRNNNTNAQTSSHLYTHKDPDLSPPSQVSSETYSYNRHSHRETTYGWRTTTQSHQHHYSSSPPPPAPSSLEKEARVGRPETEQDLSQSAFPALNPSDRSCGLFPFLGQEARSLEDLPCGVGQLSFDRDSDKASSKSLPAVQGKGNKGRVNYPVSYASIASANTPRQSVDSSQAASVSSSMCDSTSEESAVTPTTAMKWKGSPQERRHSIGSAPEDLSKAVSGNSLQRTGSQEMLPRDKDSPEKGGRGMASPVNVLAVSGGVSPVGCASDQEKVESVLACPSTGPDSDNRQTVPGTEAPTQAALSGSVANTIPAVCVTSPTVLNGTASLTTTLTSSPNTHQSSNLSRSRGTQPSSGLRSQSVPGIPQSKTKTTKPANNGIKKKIVIFCDASEDENRNCGYSFGDLPVSWTSGGSLVMPSGSESVGSSVSVGKDIVTATRSPSARCPTAVANCSSISSTSTSHTISSNVEISDQHFPNLEMPSGGEVRDSAGSSHCKTIPVNASSGSASLRDQSSASDSKPSDFSVKCDVNPVNEATGGGAVPPSRVGPSGNNSVNTCDRDASKQAKGPHIAGLNGVIAGHSLVISRATEVAEQSPGDSAPAPIPANGSSSSSGFDAGAGRLKEADAQARAVPESLSVPLNSSPVQSPTDGERETAAQSTEDSSQAAGDHTALPPAKLSLPVYRPLQEPLDLTRQQIHEDNRRFLSKGWELFEDNMIKNANKVIIFSTDNWMLESSKGMK